jgi:hypothetical protein
MNVDFKTIPIFHYGIVGKEVCPTTGRQHLQCYFELKKQTRFNAIKKALPDGCHIESRKGSQQQSIDYCKKDNKCEEFGSMRIAGRPTSIELRNLVLNGERLSTIVNNNDLTFNDIKFIEKLKGYQPEPPISKPEVYWIHGSPGSGKTTQAYELGSFFKVDNYSKNRTKWWDGCDEQETIIFNDWRPSEYWTADTTLRILGGEPERVETKGSSTWIRNCKRIIITCKKPEDVWMKNHRDEEIQQLIRRIDHMIDMDQVDHGSGSGNTRAEPSQLRSLATM